MRYLVKMSFKGTMYSGWAKQPNKKGVQDAVEDVLSHVLNQKISVYASGRTDAGVHAKGMTFHFDTNKKITDFSLFLYSLNILTSDDLHFISIKKVKDDFHARYSAKEKEYLYQFYLGKNDPFLNDLYAHVPYKIDYSLFVKTINLFVGKHCYQNFTSKEEDEDNFVRIISNIKVYKNQNIVKVKFIGNGFMRYMIRYMVGTAIEVARGKLDFSLAEKLLNQNDRKIVSFKAEPEGLYLIKVKY